MSFDIKLQLESVWYIYSSTFEMAKEQTDQEQNQQTHSGLIPEITHCNPPDLEIINRINNIYFTKIEAELKFLKLSDKTGKKKSEKKPTASDIYFKC